MAVLTVHRTHVPGFSVKRGKVRDVYDLGDRILLVATDRISAFDCVLPDPIPHKGRVLSAMSRFWFERFAGMMPHHMIASFEDQPPAGFESYAAQFRGRAITCRKAEVIPIECVARGFLAGSGWREYRASGALCGIRLPPGLKQCAKLPEPIFTPTTKAAVGHDENISFEEAARRVGRETISEMRDKTLALYSQAAQYALDRGIIVADTKFEFGWCDGQIILIDEVLTPDSSRFWPAADYAEGRDQRSFDKQFVRNCLQDLCDQGRWNKVPPAPPLPSRVIRATSERYLEAYARLIGKPLDAAN